VDGTFERADFAYDHQADVYLCPAGKQLRQRQKVYRDPRPLVDEDGLMRYRASKFDCDPCSLKPRCCPNAPARKIPRSIYEGARDMARPRAATTPKRAGLGIPRRLRYGLNILVTFSALASDCAN
jgi:hypothetical protein